MAEEESSDSFTLGDFLKSKKDDNPAGEAEAVPGAEAETVPKEKAAAVPQVSAIPEEAPIQDSAEVPEGEVPGADSEQAEPSEDPPPGAG
jgi:hypothetical protein